MGFQTQGGEDLLQALTFAVIYGLAFAAVWALYSLGSLPGRIARSRRHPNATAIGVCGWVGLPLLALWPIALAWAYTPPKQRRRRRPTEKERTEEEWQRRTVDAAATGLREADMDALAAGLRETSEKIAALESRMRVHSSKQVA